MLHTLRVSFPFSFYLIFFFYFHFSASDFFRFLGNCPLPNNLIWVKWDSVYQNSTRIWRIQVLAFTIYAQTELYLSYLVSKRTASTLFFRVLRILPSISHIFPIILTLFHCSFPRFVRFYTRSDYESDLAEIFPGSAASLLTQNCLKLEPITLCLYPEGRDLISDTVRSSGHWESDITNVIAKALRMAPGNSVFLDVGANLGVHSLSVAAMGYPVWAVEPVRSNLVSRYPDQAVYKSKASKSSFFKCIKLVD